MNSMTYKGYFAKISFDERDNIFWGKVIGTKDSITFEGETVEQLTQDFHNAIDHYLADCKKEEHPPYKPYSGMLALVQLNRPLSMIPNLIAGTSFVVKGVHT